MVSLQLTMYLTIVSGDVLSGVLSWLESESAHDNRAHDNRFDSRQTQCCDQTQLDTPDSTCSSSEQFGHTPRFELHKKSRLYESDPSLVWVWLELTLVVSKNKKWCTILYVISNNPSLIIT